MAAHGATAGCVNAGGDLRVFGDCDWPTALRRPDAPGEVVALPPLRNRALATSADTFAPGGGVVNPASARRCGARGASRCSRRPAWMPTR